MSETFANQPESRWRFFTDGVMGGISSGKLDFVDDDGKTAAHLTGDVSTANNGGFIQMQTRLEAPLPRHTTGVRLVVRGNGQHYFVHLRSANAPQPTAFHRASFDTAPKWQETFLPFINFAPSRPTLSPQPDPAQIVSLAIVAYGRDHAADIMVSKIGFY